jgi:hypothetical protein
MRGPQQIDLSGAAVLSGGSGTSDVQMVSSSLLTLPSISRVLLPVIGHGIMVGNIAC